MARKRQFWFSAEGQERDGSVKSFSVYKSGKSIYITGPDIREYLCHPIVKARGGTVDAVKREIAVVFGVKVTKVEYPEVRDRRGRRS